MSDNAQDRPVLTEEMVNAGVGVLLSFNPAEDSTRETIVEIFEAMTLAMLSPDCACSPRTQLNSSEDL